MAVDYNKLRKKFPIKNSAAKKKNAAKIKAIAREYERKKAELKGGAPVIKKGIVFYAVVIIGLMMLGSLVLSATGRGGKARNSKAMIQARSSMDALAQALGRYRFHVGRYPTTTEGLEELTRIRPELKGWFGPYTSKIVKDPWGNKYVYAEREEGGHPVLYSKGPDGRAGSTDDILPDQELFEKPFRDTTWTNHWMPYQLRGIVLAPDEATRKRIQEEVKRY